MSSKKYRGKTCVYCASEESTTADHVVARQFFPQGSGTRGPKVPACIRCNSEKSALETDLTAVLAFGSNSHSAQRVLTESIPARLSKNRRLSRELSFLAEQRWDTCDSGLLVPGINLPVDEHKIEQLIAMIAKGFIWKHFETLIDGEYTVRAGALSELGEANFKSRFFPDLSGAVYGDLAEGSFQYVGKQGVDYPQLSIWLMRFYTGVALSDKHSDQKSTCFFACSGRSEFFEKPAISEVIGGAT